MIKSLTGFRTVTSWLLFLTLAGLVHICAVLWMAATGNNRMLAVATETPPINTFRVHPPVTPVNQPLPFIMPEGYYAICAFDLSERPLRVSAFLPERGWTFSIHAEDGAGFYYAPGSSDDTRTVSLDVLPPGDELNGLEITAAPGDLKIAQITSPTVRGLAVVKAPAFGKSYTATSIEQLQRSGCQSVGRPNTRVTNAG